MKPAPWSCVQIWDCTACGECCREYTVNIGFNEWLRIVKQYGIEVTKQGLTECCVRKRVNGRCVFQYKMGLYWMCGLQHMKPKACMLWPFKIYSKPKYGRKEEAFYHFEGKVYYVYVDPNCRGIYWGKPDLILRYKVIPELIQLAFGKTGIQTYSTSQRLFTHHQIRTCIKV